MWISRRTLGGGGVACRRSALLALHAAGELDRREAEALEVHLALCSRCRDELSEIRDINDLVTVALSPPPAGEATRARVIARIRAGLESPHVPPAWPWARLVNVPALLGAAALVLLSLVEAASFSGLEEQVVVVAVYLGLI